MDKLLKKKKELIIGVVLLLAVILCIVFLVTNGKDKKEKNNDNNIEDTSKTPQDVVFTEEDLKSAYGVSKEDAINLVKPLFNSDNFEYTAVVTNKAKYLVTVKNTISKKEYKFEVDPVTKSYYEIEK